MEGLTVQPWRKWGHDFLYVNDAAGTTLGYFDRSNGLLHVSDEDVRPAVVYALWTQVFKGILPPGSWSAGWSVPAGSDLASRVAGAAVAEQAARLSAGRFQRWAARLLGLRTAATSWDVGARGERIMGRRLERLRACGWEVLHSIPLASGADIDHLVIGPGGVFTINTKHHAGARVSVGRHRVWVNGSAQEYIRNSRHEAAAAARRLSEALGRTVPVCGVVAFVNPGPFSMKEPPSDALVTSDKTIASVLRSRPAVLSVAEAQAVFQAARRAEIWTSR